MSITNTFIALIVLSDLSHNTITKFHTNLFQHIIFITRCRYDTGLKKPNRRIDTLEQLLSKQSYLLGDKFTIADVAVASYLLYVPQFFQDIDLSRWPNVVRYMKECASREMYGKAFGPQVQNFLVQKMDSMGGGEKKLFGLF